jgi:hypothetical protein
MSFLVASGAAVRPDGAGRDSLSSLTLQQLTTLQNPANGVRPDAEAPGDLVDADSVELEFEDLVAECVGHSATVSVFAALVTPV